MVILSSPYLRVFSSSDKYMSFWTILRSTYHNNNGPRSLLSSFIHCVLYIIFIHISIIPIHSFLPRVFITVWHTVMSTLQLQYTPALMYSRPPASRSAVAKDSLSFPWIALWCHSSLSEDFLFSYILLFYPSSVLFLFQISSISLPLVMLLYNLHQGPDIQAHLR